jgi:GPH family glycoside/pentoside/hexuronide:cation symporter
MTGTEATAEEVLPVRVKLGYSLGDHTINIQLAAVSLFFLFFLTEVAGLAPAWAGLVLLIGRAVDAFTDPAMGRLSDRTRWRLGRRRPFFLIGAVPFGVTFALRSAPRCWPCPTWRSSPRWRSATRSAPR